jgi:sugar phosphate isomerase/epimerase
MISALSRRSLLGGFVGSGLAWEMVRAGIADQGPARKFTIDLVCGNIGVRVRLPEAIALAHKYGFESVAPDAGFLKSLSDSQLSELREDLKAKNLVWGAAGLAVNFRGATESFRDGMNVLQADGKALERAGVSRIGTWISPGHNSLTYLSNFKQHVSRLSEIGKALSEHGIRLGLEYVGPKTSWSATKYPFIHTMAEMRELIAATGQPNIGLVLDSWHWYTAHETEGDLLRLKGSEVVCCDLNDAPAGIPVDQQRDNTRDLPCATGVIDLKAFLGALVKIGFDGPVRAEPFKSELRRLAPDEAVDRTAKAMKQAVRLLE